jgi:hypothetical protein
MSFHLRLANWYVHGKQIYPRIYWFFFKWKKIRRWDWELLEISFFILAKNSRLEALLRTLGDTLLPSTRSPYLHAAPLFSCPLWRSASLHCSLHFALHAPLPPERSGPSSACSGYWPERPVAVMVRREQPTVFDGVNYIQYEVELTFEERFIQL